MLGSGGSVSAMVAFGYNDQGDRVRRQVDSDPATKYLTDHENPTGYSQVLAELDASGASAQAEYLYADGYGPSAQWDDESDVLAYLHGDHLGSTRLLTNAAGSDISGAMDYSPYGEPLATPGSLTTYAFTGQPRDGLLPLQYHRARWLKLATGNWLSQDGIFDYPGNLGNLYLYGAASPIVNVDVSGNLSLTELGVVSAIASTIAVSMDTYVNGWRGFNHAFQVAAMAAGAAVLVTLLMAGGMALLAAAGLNAAEAGLVLGLLSAPVDIGLAAYSCSKMPDTERGQKAKYVIIALSILSVVLPYYSYYKSLPYKVSPHGCDPLQAGTPRAPIQTIKNMEIEVYHYSQFPNPRRLLDSVVTRY